MDVDTYFKTFPEAKGHITAPSLIGGWDKSNKGVLRQGAIQFDDETASCWAGPFPGGCAAYVLYDTRLWNPGNTLEPIAKAQSKALDILHKWLEGKPKDKHLLLAMLERVLNGDASTIHQVTEGGTAEHPYRIWMLGTDDHSYAKWFSTQEEAEALLDLMEATEPLDFDKDFMTFIWTFTN